MLLSGGIDSTACTHFYLSQGRNVNALFVNYGQMAVRREASAAKRISRYFSIPFNVVSFTRKSKQSAGLVLGRNAFLLFLALTQFKYRSGLIAIGVHSGTTYFDCSPTFIGRMQSLFDGYSGGQVQIGAPFLRWTKREIWDYCIKEKIPVTSTYSCELGRMQPCGRCVSCQDLERLYARP